MVSISSDLAPLTAQSMSVPEAPQTVTPPSHQSDQTSETKKPFPALSTRVFTMAELVSQPWLPSLRLMINESYLNNHYHPIGLRRERLRSDTELFEELGADAFTVVAFAESVSSNGEEMDMDLGVFNDGGSPKIVATASVKPWVRDGGWQKPYTYVNNHTENGTDTLDGETGDYIRCRGDYEFTLVAVQPAAEYRKRDIADHLIGICEREILLRRRRTQDEDKTSNSESIKLMLRTAQACSDICSIMVVTVGECPKTSARGRALIRLIGTASNGA